MAWILKKQYDNIMNKFFIRPYLQVIRVAKGTTQGGRVFLTRRLRTSVKSVPVLCAVYRKKVLLY